MPRTHLLVVALLVGGCTSTSVDPCDGSLADATPHCATAIRLAARQTGGTPADAPTVERVSADLTAARSVVPRPEPIEALTVTGGRANYVASTARTDLSAWTDGGLLTGDPAIDAILSTHRVVAGWYFGSAGESAIYELVLPPGATLTDQVALLSDLEAHALDPAYRVASTEVTWTPRTSTDAELTFTLGWGDCPLGCIYHHTWTVATDPTGATLLAETGDPIPDGPLNRAPPP